MRITVLHELPDFHDATSIWLTWLPSLDPRNDWLPSNKIQPCKAINQHWRPTQTHSMHWTSPVQCTEGRLRKQAPPQDSASSLHRPDGQVLFETTKAYDVKCTFWNISWTKIIASAWHTFIGSFTRVLFTSREISILLPNSSLLSPAHVPHVSEASSFTTDSVPPTWRSATSSVPSFIGTESSTREWEVDPVSLRKLHLSDKWFPVLAAYWTSGRSCEKGPLPTPSSEILGGLGWTQHWHRGSLTVWIQPAART